MSILKISVFSMAVIGTAMLSHSFSAATSQAAEATANTTGVAVGPQYDTTHVYVAPADMDAFVTSFTVTFGGQPSKQIVVNVLPVPSSTKAQYVWTPVGSLSVFAFVTPVPYPFGQERTGYLVADMVQAIKAARQAGAEVIVEPFKDPIGVDAVIQFSGGMKTQLYWHNTVPSYAPLTAIPENRVYVSRDKADEFVREFISFSQGKVVADKQADAGEIGRSETTYRKILIESAFGKMQVLVTDGHLPYPFGHELTGYQVDSLRTTLEKAKAAGVKVLTEPYDGVERTSAILQFPGGYIAEVHALKAAQK